MEQQRVQRGFEGNRNKHNEICSTIQQGSWSFSPVCENRSVDELYQLLGYANANNCNLLLNVGPMDDGSINPRHAETLLQLGDKIRKKGFPENGCPVRQNICMGAE